MGTGIKFLRSLKTDITRLRYKKVDFKNTDRQKIIWPFKILFHPFDGISDIKYEKKGSVTVANIVLLFFFITNVLRYFYTGFIFNMKKTDEFNVVMELLTSVILIVLWTVSNWAVSTLMDGEGRFTEIWIVSCYALLPVILSNCLTILLSNVMIHTESVFLSLVNGTGMLWAVALILIGILIVHQYSLTKAILCCLITLFGIAVILFISILFISIVQQMYGFMNTVSIEILNRS